MSLIAVHFVPILLSILIFMLLGALWYSPLMFGRVRIESMGYRPEELLPAGKAYVGAVLNAFVTVYVLALFVHHTGAGNAIEGVKIAFWAWLGFAATTRFSSVLWENLTAVLFLIHAGYQLLAMLIAGALLGAWE